MIKFPDKISLLLIMITVIHTSGCKDENITNTYLNLTKNSRIDEIINLDSENILINVTVKNFSFNEAVGSANVSLILPDGRILIKSTDVNGKTSFIVEKTLKGKFEISAESHSKVFQGNTYFEIPETLNYSLVIYVKE